MKLIFYTPCRSHRLSLLTVSPPPTTTSLIPTSYSPTTGPLLPPSRYNSDSNVFRGHHLPLSRSYFFTFVTSRRIRIWTPLYHLGPVVTDGCTPVYNLRPRPRHTHRPSHYTQKDFERPTRSTEGSYDVDSTRFWFVYMPQSNPYTSFHALFS